VTDILHAVNDGSISWMQRVKLVRYAWVSEDVMLLNKKQILMNSLISAVSGAQRYVLFLFLSHCMECRCGLAMRIMSVCLSVQHVHCDKTE